MDGGHEMREVVVDAVTSLPLTLNLLAYYREQLKETQKQSNSHVLTRLKLIQQESGHLHELDRSLSSAVRTIKEYEVQNEHLGALLKEMIEENACLRINRGMRDCRDLDLLQQMLHSIASRAPISDHSDMIAALVKRCESLEQHIVDIISDLMSERSTSQALRIKLTETRECLRVREEQVEEADAKIAALPSLQDFEYLRQQASNLQGGQQRDGQEIKALKEENDRLRQSLSARHQPSSAAQCDQLYDAGAQLHQPSQSECPKANEARTFGGLRSATAAKCRAHENVQRTMSTEDQKTQLQDIEQRLQRRIRGRQAAHFST